MLKDLQPGWGRLSGQSAFVTDGASSAAWVRCQKEERAIEEERVVTRRNFKVKLPDEMMELVMVLDGVIQRKEMYEHMRQHMMGLFSAHQGDEQTLLKSFCIERGKRELLVHLT